MRIGTYVARFSRLIGLLLCSVWLSSCALPSTVTPTISPPLNSPTAPTNQRLRITNAGELPIVSLTVIFPDGRAEFGDVAPGATTDYLVMPGGVYRYAAYSFAVDGDVKSQPVIDWVGERPLPGSDFTYTLYFDPGKLNELRAIELATVTTDN